MEIHVCQSCGHIVHSHNSQCEGCGAATAGNTVAIDPQVIAKVVGKFKSGSKEAVEALKTALEQEQKTSISETYKSSPKAFKFNTRVWGGGDQEKSGSFTGLISNLSKEQQALTEMGPASEPAYDEARQVGYEYQPQAAPPNEYEFTTPETAEYSPPVPDNEDDVYDPQPAEAGFEYIPRPATQVLPRTQGKVGFEYVPSPPPPTEDVAFEYVPQAEPTAFQFASPAEDEPVASDAHGMQEQGEHAPHGVSETVTEQAPEQPAETSAVEAAEYHPLSDLGSAVEQMAAAALESAVEQMAAAAPEAVEHPPQFEPELSLESLRRSVPVSSFESDPPFEAAPPSVQVQPRDDAKPDERKNANPEVFEPAVEYKKGTEEEASGADFEPSRDPLAAMETESISVSLEHPDAEPVVPTVSRLSEGEGSPSEDRGDDGAPVAIPLESPPASQDESLKKAFDESVPEFDEKHLRRVTATDVSQAVSGKTSSIPFVEPVPSPKLIGIEEFNKPRTDLSPVDKVEGIGEQKQEKGDETEKPTHRRSVERKIHKDKPEGTGKPKPIAKTILTVALIVAPVLLINALNRSSHPQTITASNKGSDTGQPAPGDSNLAPQVVPQQTQVSQQQMPQQQMTQQPVPQQAASSPQTSPDNSIDSFALRNAPPVQITRTVLQPVLSGKWNFQYQNPSGSTGYGSFNMIQAGPSLKGWGADTSGQFQIKGVVENDIAKFGKIYVKDGKAATSPIVYSGKISQSLQQGNVPSMMLLSGMWKYKKVESDGVEHNYGGHFEAQQVAAKPFLPVGEEAMSNAEPIMQSPPAMAPQNQMPANMANGMQNPNQNGLLQNSQMPANNMSDGSLLGSNMQQSKTTSVTPSDQLANSVAGFTSFVGQLFMGFLGLVVFIGGGLFLFYGPQGLLKDKGLEYFQTKMRPVETKKRPRPAKKAKEEDENDDEDVDEDEED